jgi:dTDP-4-amino-4,6-dideoxygalactose transaminase
MLNSLKMTIRPIVIKALDAINIEPALVKAIIKKPPMVHGGSRTRRWPWPRRKHFDKRESAAVMRVMNREIKRGGAIVYGGPEEKAYSQEFAEYLGGGFAKAVNSGTNAVYVALRALDLEPGSEVIVPAITDAGGTMPVALMNCIPVPADTQPRSLNSSVNQIQAALSDRTAAIVVAHISGQPVDLDPILKLAAERKIPVVEDCAQAHGALYKGQLVGTFGAVSAFSTMFGKHHCTGAQGGVVFTRDTLLFARVRQIADRGKPHGALGTPTNLVASLNFNQNEISMAIGRVQIDKLPASIQARRFFALQVEAGLRDVEGIAFLGDPPNCSGSYWFLTIWLDDTKLACDSAEFAVALEREGIGGTAAGYPFFPTDQPWCRDAVIFGQSGLPWSALSEHPKLRHFELHNAHQASRHIVRIDVHESLGPREARDLAAAVRKIAQHYKKVSSATAAAEISYAMSR